jgi:hypothetical protein
VSLYKWSPVWQAKQNVGFLKWLPAHLPVEALAEPLEVERGGPTGTDDGPAEMARAFAMFPDLYGGEPE